MVLYYYRCTVTVVFSNGHCAVTVRSLYGHCTVTVRSRLFPRTCQSSMGRYATTRPSEGTAPPFGITGSCHPPRSCPPSPRAGACTGAPCPKCCRRGSSAASVSQCGANDPDIYPGSPSACFSTEVLSPHTAVDLLPQRVITRIQVGAARGDVQVSETTFETTAAAKQ